VLVILAEARTPRNQIDFATSGTSDVIQAGPKLEVLAKKPNAL
jgi:hypothetical protein